ncbi:MAG TPA: tRNA (N(6)-L-threonylcarbamoyladenosine(37)-C(2))-methylthiotransferase MtaB [Candidatus Eisenbacteria bacterium]|nr:tRNA (N(6)-L-threonylcarbamoyladenosine(37)-C(2))-methylthiotransferase MtaB [Candidatus Eisenbacteria bacterium]
MIRSDRHEPGERNDAPRVSFFTLGCRLNQHDTAADRARVEAAGMRTVGEREPADVVVVNTCTVTRRADQEARQLVRRIARQSPWARIVVTGCYAQRAPEEIAALPGVAAVVGIRDRAAIADRIRGLAAAKVHPADVPATVAPRALSSRARMSLRPEAPLSFGRTRALLKVQDGCDSFCSYCVVPYVRGRARSLPLAQALEQGRRLLDASFHEIVVTGADLGTYGRDLGSRDLLPRLVRGLLDLGSHHRVRLSSIEPNKVPSELVEMIGSEPRLCRHLHLPLQSGSDRILQAMRRPYRASDYASLVRRSSRRGPVGIGTDVIVGHPGEGDREFEETFAFVRDLPVAFLHVFRYSSRPGTAAARLGPPVPDPVARERSERLRALGAAKRATFLRSLVGMRLQVLPEAGSDPSYVPARSDTYAMVHVTPVSRSRSLGTAVITGATGEYCTGTLEASR